MASVQRYFVGPVRGLRNVCHRRALPMVHGARLPASQSFFDIKVRDASKGRVVDASHVFTLDEWESSEQLQTAWNGRMDGRSRRHSNCALS